MSSPRLTSSAIPRSIKVGEVTVHYVPDGFVELAPALWYQNPELGAIPGTNSDGWLTASVGLLVIDEPDGCVIIDAGLGPLTVSSSQTPPPLGVMYGGRAAKYSLDDKPVHTVAVTHAHEDHVGWLRTISGPGPTLRSADIVVGAADAARLSHLTGLTQLRAVDHPTPISAHVTSVPTPGHTAGHTAYVIESDGERAVCFGDTFHSPWQLTSPDSAVWSDEMPERADRSRALVLDLLSEHHTVGVGYHFADVVFGRWDGSTWNAI